MIVGTTILKKKENVAPLNARESAVVADQYYRSATIGNSERRSRFEVGRKNGRGNGSLAASFAEIECVRKEWN